MKKLIITGILFFLWGSLPARDNFNATYFAGEWITSKEGLSQGMINSILQDAEGYIWFATKDGLNKYDGYTITVYRHNPDDNYSLPDNYVNFIFEDNNKNIWVNTLSRGLYIFEKNTERFFPVTLTTAKQENNAIAALSIRNNKLLIQKTNDLLIYDIGAVRPGNYTKGFADKIKLVFSYNQLQKDKRFSYQFNQNNQKSVSWLTDGTVWIKYPDTLIYAIPDVNKNKWMLKGYAPSVFGLSKDAFRYVTFDQSPQQDSNLYYLFKNKLCLFNLHTKSTKQVMVVTDKPTPVCLKMETLPDGLIYFFLGDSFLFNPQTNILQKIMVERDHEPFTAMYTSICKDNTGTAWYGSAGFGVFKSDMLKPAFRVYKSGDNADAFRLFYGQNWVDNEQLIRRMVAVDFNNFLRDKQGSFWFSNFLTEKGMEVQLNRFNPGTKSFTHYDFFKKNFYSSINFFEDNKDSLWIFLDEGLNKKMLYRFNKETGLADFTAQFPVQPANNNQYPFIAGWWQDALKNYWFATVQGLFRYTAANNQWKQWRNIPGKTNSLPSDMLFTICPDAMQPLQYLWVGTNGAGFCRFDIVTGTCLRFTDKDGLPNNVVYGIVSDSAGNLWMSTNKGLSCFNTTNKMFRNFTKEDNLPGEEFNRNQYATLPNGQLFFGGVDGYTVFNPAEVLKTKPPVPIVFTGLSISNKWVDWKKDSTVLNTPIGYAKKIILQPGQNMFTISFASLDFRSNEKKFYTYRLEGFDDQWTNPTNKNEATYTNLSPGQYTFFVTGTNTDGVWNSKNISIIIEVLPYWYQTSWFKILMALLLSGSLYALYRYRLQQQLKLLTIRNRIAGDLHDEIGSTLSSISLSSTIIQQKLTGESKDVQNLLHQISKHTDNMMEAMSDIVWAINTRNDNFESVINRMRAFAIEILEPIGITIHFSISDGVLRQNLDMVQRKNTYLLFKEAINNTAKYAACKNVWVTIELHGKKITMHIKDDGKGFAFTAAGANTTPNNSFGGNGLPGMYKRALELNGTLTINAAHDMGTTISLTFPV